MGSHWLEYAPLRDEYDVRQAWVMACRPDLLAGMGEVTPGQAEAFRDRIQAAAVEFGMGFLPDPLGKPGKEPGTDL